MDDMKKLATSITDKSVSIRYPQLYAPIALSSDQLNDNFMCLETKNVKKKHEVSKIMGVSNAQI